MAIVANIFEIPLTSQAQVFSISLAGVPYRLSVIWNDVNQSWILDIRDAGGVDIVTGIPLVTGRDLLDPFRYLGIGGSLVVQSDCGVDYVPDFTNLGNQGHLYFVIL